MLGSWPLHITIREQIKNIVMPTCGQRASGFPEGSSETAVLNKTSVAVPEVLCSFRGESIQRTSEPKPHLSNDIASALSNPKFARWSRQQIANFGFGALADNTAAFFDT